MGTTYLIFSLFFAMLPSLCYQSCITYRRQCYYIEHGDYYDNCFDHTITCVDIASVQEINYGSYEFDSYYRFNLTFVFENSDISTIPLQFFNKTTNVRRLDLGKNHIKLIESGAFIGLTSLQELRLDNNELTVLSNGVLNSLHNLKILDLTNNLIHTIEKQAMMGVISLTGLYLKNNNLSRTEDDFLEQQKRLKNLDISGNPLEKESVETMLMKLSNMTILDMSSIQLSPLNVFLFPKVSELYMAHNQFEILEKGIFDKSKNITVVDFSFNKISKIDGEVFHGLTALDRLMLQYNNITKLNIGIFQDLTNLTFLDLCHNGIEQFEFGTFAALKKLRFLNISSNRLIDLDQHVLNPLSQLSYLYFDNNQISSLDVKNLLTRHKFLNVVSLDNNIWNCQKLAQIELEFSDRQVKVFEGQIYSVPNVRGIACSDRKIPEKIGNSSDFDTDDLARIFRRIIDGGVKDSKMVKFFGEDFENSNLFRYFDQGYARSNFFKYLDNYKFAAVEKNNMNDTKMAQLSTLQVTPHDDNNKILIFIAVFQVMMCLCLIFMIYLKFNFSRYLKSSGRRCQMPSEVELCQTA